LLIHFDDDSHKYSEAGLASTISSSRRIKANRVLELGTLINPRRVNAV
jgi:hypothetical protein